MRRRVLRLLLPAATLAATVDLGRLRADADLSLATQASPDPVAAGARLTFQLTVLNHGPDAATSVVLQLVLPSGLYLGRAGALIFADGFESGDLSAWSQIVAGPSGCSQSGNVVQCSLGTLAANATITRTLGVEVPTHQQGELETTVSVASAVADPDPSDNLETIATVLVQRADLRLTGLAAPDPVAAGGILTTSWTVTNLGPSPATSVMFEDPLPPELTRLSVDPSQGSCSGTQVLLCNLGSLGAGWTATVELVAGVASSATIALTHTASVVAAETDLELSNNLATVVTTVE